MWSTLDLSTEYGEATSSALRAINIEIHHTETPVSKRIGEKLLVDNISRTMLANVRLLFTQILVVTCIVALFRFMSPQTFSRKRSRFMAPV